MCNGHFSRSRSSFLKRQFGSGPGRDDTPFFCASKTKTSQAVGQALQKLGAVQAHGAASVDWGSVPPPEEVLFSDKSPVFLDVSNVHLVHEPEFERDEVNVEISEEKILKPAADVPPVDPRWDGNWHGSEESRLLYLKTHRHLWAFVRPEQVKSRTSCFF